MKLHFDHERSCTPSKESIDAMISYLSQPQEAKVEEARRAIYHLVDASPEDQFVFTSSGAEAINHVVLSVYLDVTRKTGKHHFITSTVEEAPLMMSMSRLQDMGCFFEKVAVNAEGFVDGLTERISPRTVLISLSLANGMTGVIQPIEEIAALCKDRGILLHVDGTHLLGKGEFSFKDSGVDFLTFNGAELNAPAGTGGLFCRSGVNLTPFIMGGGMRGGDENLPGLIGLGRAASDAEEMRDYYMTEIARLRDLLEKKLGGRALFKESARVPNVSAVVFPLCHAEALRFFLEQKGLFANLGGRECQQMPLLMKSLGVAEAYSVLSFMLAREMKKSEIEKAAEIIEEAIEKLKRVML